MRHHNSVHVRWADLDAFGHINNAVYLTYVQEARADMTWYSRQTRGLTPLFKDMVVARAELDFVEAIYVGGVELDVAIWVERIGNASFVLSYEMSRNGVLHARAKTVQVAVSMETFKSRPINEVEREFLNEYFEETPLSK